MKIETADEHITRLYKMTAVNTWLIVAAMLTLVFAIVVGDDINKKQIDAHKRHTCMLMERDRVWDKGSYCDKIITRWLEKEE